MILTNTSRTSANSRRIRRRTLLLSSLVVALLVIVNLPTARAAGTESTEGFDVHIVGACYADLDSDGYEDDVFAYVRFDLGVFSYYEFAYIITLILPSGAEYSYMVYVWAWADYIYTNNEFLGHATESGDYQVIVDAVLLFPDSAGDSHSYVFDPPGGSEGGPPAFRVY